MLIANSSSERRDREHAVVDRLHRQILLRGLAMP